MSGGDELLDELKDGLAKELTRWKMLSTAKSLEWTARTFRGYADNWRAERDRHEPTPAGRLGALTAEETHDALEWARYNSMSQTWIDAAMELEKAATSIRTGVFRLDP